MAMCISIQFPISGMISHLVQHLCYCFRDESLVAEY
jgi:hypothetical protein